MVGTHLIGPYWCNPRDENTPHNGLYIWGDPKGLQIYAIDGCEKVEKTLCFCDLFKF